MTLDFSDVVRVCIIIFVTVATIALVIYLWQYILLITLLCAIVGALIGLFLSIRVLIEAHKIVQ